jgi:hypothetical protein
MMEEGRTIMMYLGNEGNLESCLQSTTFMFTKHAVIKPLREEEETTTNGVALEHLAQLLSVK